MRGDSVWVIIPAGGRGVRMGRKKPGIVVGGRSVLAWTLDVFERTRAVQGVVVAVPAEDVAAWRRRLRGCRKLRAVVAGGLERQDSVRLALEVVPADAAWIIVHDGVRPCITRDLVRRVLAAAQAHGAAIAALPITETLKRGTAGWVEETLDRDGVWAVQTPQAFRAGLLREAHRRACKDGVVATDDAALVERLGTPVWLAPGLAGNIKVTRTEDVGVARALLRHRGLR
jgi:2-C-methyl-D-erythritol 4-phosphate cytidylyltransferase